MPVNSLVVDDRRVEQILAASEGHFLDKKAIEVGPAKLSKALSAFANADGGDLYVGIDETPRGWTWRGFADEEDANNHLQTLDALFPLGDGFEYSFLTNAAQPGVVLHVLVLRSASIRRASDDKVYVRRGAASNPITSDASLRQLERDKGITSFESETIAVEEEAITNSETTITFMLDAFPQAEPKAFMQSQRVLVSGHPTVAGTLLYADVPQALLPKRSSVKVYRYTTTAAEGTRETLAGQPVTIEGPLYSQIADAVAATTEMVESVKRLEAGQLVSVSYPPETLHEIITNAVIHRDYGVADDIHIRVFDNRVEVESPGRLAGHVSTTNILDERFSRNGNVVRLINKFPDPPNKDVGEGLNTAFAAMKSLKLKEPLIEELEHSVRVSIRHERLATPEQMIMEYLEDHEEVTNRIVREMTGLGSENAVKNAFYNLRDAGKVERVPDKKGTLSAWRKVQ